MLLCWKESCTKLISIDLCQVTFRAFHRPIRRADECYWRREVNNTARYELLPHWSILRRYFIVAFQNIQFPTTFIPIRRVKRQEISCAELCDQQLLLVVQLQRSAVTKGELNHAIRRKKKFTSVNCKIRIHSRYIYLIDAVVHSSGKMVVRKTEQCTVATVWTQLLHFFPLSYQYVHYFTRTKQKAPLNRKFTGHTRNLGVLSLELASCPLLGPRIWRSLPEF
jgi:hypothetical protein